MHPIPASCIACARAVLRHGLSPGGFGCWQRKTCLQLPSPGVRKLQMMRAGGTAGNCTENIMNVCGGQGIRLMETWASFPALESLSSVSVTDGQIDSWRAVLVCQLPAATANLPASCQLNQIGYDTSLLNKQIKLQLIIVFNFRFLNDQASWRKSTKASPR